VDVRRREFIALVGAAAATWPLGGYAQQLGKILTIGLIGANTEAVDRPRIAAFVQRLGELGWVQGRNIVIDYRSAGGIVERVGEFRAEFVRLPVAVLLTAGDAQVLAAMRAAPTIPIVFFAAGDPVGNGLVASLARPGGNVTGRSLQLTDTAGKRVELLREITPALRRVAFFGNFTNPTVALERDAAEAAARKLGLENIRSEIKAAEDIPAAIEQLKGRAEALYVCADPLISSNTARINELALEARLPNMHTYAYSVEAGGLISYGPDFPDLWRRGADTVDKILKGERPANIPVEQPTKFDLVINLKTAKALGLIVPPILLATADEMIE
jgi:putative ABC transport system substrate-binding protein